MERLEITKGLRKLFWVKCNRRVHCYYFIFNPYVMEGVTFLHRPYTGWIN